MKLEATSPKRQKQASDKFRVNIVAKKWTEKQLEDTLDLSGKKLHLFQLPPDMPVECLDGVQLPVPGKKKWSKPVRVSYTTNEGKANEQTHKVAIKAQRMVGDETLLHVSEGRLVPCESQPMSVFQGFEVLEEPDIVLPEVEESVHKLPAGLRQRFVPIGNGLSQSQSTVAVTPKPSSPKKTKHKSASKRKRQAETDTEKSPKKRRADKHSNAVDSPMADTVSDKHSKTDSVSPKKRKR